MFTRLENGFIIADSIYVGDGQAPNSALLTLRLHKGPDVVYVKDTMIVDYPGEYELSGYIIQAWSDKTDAMHYIIRFGQTKIAFIQNEQGLDSDILGGITTWFVSQDELKEVIARRELEGEVVSLAE